MADAMKLGDRHTAIMDAIHGDLMRQNAETFTEEDGNATLVIATPKPFLTIDVSSLAEAVLPLAASPPAREEAPGEGTGVILSASDRACYEYPGVDDGPLRAAFVAGAEAYSDKSDALRARTSEPAREGEAWRVERTEHAVKFWVGVQGFTVATRGDDPDGGEHLRLMEKMLRKALGRISAPATADKLRIAKEALERAKGHTQLTHIYAGIDAALATLNEEG